ncbi:MAG: NFACT family protein [Clostridia bacterium]|nr:NFACT family protein [Clostridia bacterium]
MAYDGLTTMAMVAELREKILLGKIEKVYQPEKEELVFMVHTNKGNLKLFVSVSSNGARLSLIEKAPENPPQASAFCMLMRKHLQAARIIDIGQYESDRVIEITFESLNELGFTTNKKLIVEIMGKHSNASLIDLESGKIIDSIKRVAIDVNRYRQLLPGKLYEYPPAQDKIGFKDVAPEDFAESDRDPKNLMAKISGISPATALELATSLDPYNRLQEMMNSSYTPCVYMDDDRPKEFAPFRLKEYDESLNRIEFNTISQAINYYYEHREATNRTKQKANNLLKSVDNALSKSYLKKQRLLEDINKAENSDKYRLYGELLTANLHLVPAGAKDVVLNNYYDGQEIKIPLDEKLSPSKNAQKYFKKYGKAKTALKEKAVQLEQTEHDIEYLESVYTLIESCRSPEEVETIYFELVETGYLRRRKVQGKEKKLKMKPRSYILSTGYQVLVGKNNIENDHLTMRLADKQDLWFHTKDIPGSHVVMKTNGKSVEQIDEQSIYEAAAIAAFYSKASGSSKVPVDYVPIRYVKKPNGAKPGMVIFTNNKTVYIDPKDPEK